MYIKTSLLAGLLLIIGVLSIQAQESIPISTGWSVPVVISETSTATNLEMDTDLNGVIGASWASSPTPITSTSFLELHFSRSVDRGISWSDPRRLINLGGLQANTWPRSIAAGDNGVWMIALGLKDLTPGAFKNYNGILISHDSGVTWDDLVDLTGKFPYENNDPSSIRSQDIAYAGNNTWIYLISTAEAVYYIRSTDNGQTWSDYVFLHNYRSEHPRITSSKDDHSIVINYWNTDISPSDPVTGGVGRRTSIFSNDNGQTFGDPIVSSIAASDNNGNWLLADWFGSVDRSSGIGVFDGDFIIKYTTDTGSTFRELSDPPSLKALFPNLRIFVIDTLTINSEGHIMLVGTAAVNIGGMVNMNRPGIMTRSTDLGKTWTPWEQIPYGNQSPSIAAAKDVFVSVDSAPIEGFDHSVVSARSFKSENVTAARDWQLYQ